MTQFDPIQAFFGGITTTFARVILVVTAFLVALLCYGTGFHDFSGLSLLLFPFIALGTIFAWGASGIFFFVGLLSLITFLFLAWKFIETEDPKSVFLLLFAAAFLYFVPLAWSRDFVTWRFLCVAAMFFVFYFGLGYVVPATVRYLAEKRR